MSNKIHDAFEPIHATESLKQNVNAYIHKELVKRKRKFSTPVRHALACCVMIAIMVCSIGGYKLYHMPVSYISVDMNPSVELALNYLERVVTVTAYNDDGSQILENLNLKNKSYTEAVEMLLSNKTFANYLSEDSLLSFTVISKREDKLLAGIQQCKGYTQNDGESHSVKADNMEAAHHSGLSFGKYQAYLELAEYDNTITPEDCRNLSMRQIRDLMDMYAKGEEVVDIPTSDGKGDCGNRQGDCGNRQDDCGNRQGGCGIRQGNGGTSQGGGRLD